MIDPAKSSFNLAKHGMNLEEARHFEWTASITLQDTRYDYGEQRFVSYGFIGERLHVLVWTPRNGDVRPISLRKANLRERRHYAIHTGTGSP